MSQRRSHLHRVRVGVSTAAVAGLAIAGCGGSDDGDVSSLSGDDLALAEAIGQSLADGDDGVGFSAVMDTECMGRESVVALGGAAAAEAGYGITVESVDGDFSFGELSDDDARAVIEGYSRCGDLDEVLVIAFSQGAGGEEAGRCVVEALPDGAVFEFFVASVGAEIGGETAIPIEAELQAAAESCGLG